jgi:hypothetical protein
LLDQVTSAWETAALTVFWVVAAMPNGPVLELSTLPSRHPPIGQALLLLCAAPSINRLSIDPTPQPPGTISRAVTVERIARPGKNPPVKDMRDIGWGGLANFAGNVCVQWARTVNARTVTEQAAIGVMALLVNDLEGGVLQHVLQIGSGGDYFVLGRGAKRPVQVEVSGIKEDLVGHASRSRVEQKSAQVLKHARVGYASVTTFSHPVGPVVQSFLHFVRRRRRKKKGG